MKIIFSYYELFFSFLFFLVYIENNVYIYVKLHLWKL